MAACVDSLAEELVCAICTDIFSDPVMLDCGHNYCRECILKVCQMQVQNSLCPECRCVFVKENLKRNRVLANLAEKAKDLNSAPLFSFGPGFLNKPPTKVKTKIVFNKNCKNHPNLPVEFFCEADKVLLCRTCSTTSNHKNHHLLTIKPAAKKQRKCSTKLIHNIQYNFARLHQFLIQKEHNLIQKVKNQEEKAEEPLKKTVTLIQEQIQKIEEEISILQSIIDQKDLQFLQRLAEVPKSREYIEPYISEDEPKEISLGLYEEFLQFAVWREMKKVISPVPEQLTEEHQRVGLIHFESTEQTSYLVENLLFDPSLSSKRNSTSFPMPLPLNSRKYYWEVEVQGKTEWRVGISVYPGEKIAYHMPFWDKVKTFVSNLLDEKYLLMLQNNEYSISTPRSTTTVHLQVRPQVIGLFVDYCAGHISFYNAETMSLIYKISEHFKGELYAYIDPGNYHNGFNSEPLKIPALSVKYCPPDHIKR
ncbi:zinc-binding protein A33-like isoform X2 [Protopterus annectens]|uniref:zinc-binding protein A33-like isoform X2 n=1 Tax=Protopterus annectens TaxID=7888 RepID=UPI001CF9B151|nr:zinc-binding protein A33-like isoform X2 [Protopterus annectens]